MSTHLDTDALADLLDGEASPRQLRHVAACCRCRVALEELRAAQDGVRAALGALPSPEVPDDLAAQLDRALLRSREQGWAAGADTAGPTGEPARRARVLAGSAAAVLALSGLALVLSRPAETGSATLASAAPARISAAPSGTAVPVADLGALVTVSSDADYGGGTAALREALPALLDHGRGSGTPAPAASSDPLARLRDPQELRACLAALPDARRHGAPLVLEYAHFRGAAALLAVFPSPLAPDLLDVLVVGAGCRQGHPAVLMETEVARAS